MIRARTHTFLLGDQLVDRHLLGLHYGFEHVDARCGGGFEIVEAVGEGGDRGVGVVGLGFRHVVWVVMVVDSVLAVL